MFHLFILVKLFPEEKNGAEKVLSIEKNHVVEIKSARWDTDDKTESVTYNTTTDMTLKKLFAEAEQRVGAEKLFVYDARTQNCQFFIKWLLDRPGRGGWSDKINSFVMQNAEKVLDGMGLLSKATKVITDVANIADVALNGAGHRSRDGRRR